MLAWCWLVLCCFAEGQLPPFQPTRNHRSPFILTARLRHHPRRCEDLRHSPSRPLGYHSLADCLERPTEEIPDHDLHPASCFRTDILGGNQWPPTGETTRVSYFLRLRRFVLSSGSASSAIASCSHAESYHSDYTGPSRAPGSATHVLDARLNLLTNLVPGIFTAKTCLDVGCNAGNVSTQLCTWKGSPGSCSKRLYLQASHIDPCYSFRFLCSISHWRRHRSKASGPSRKTSSTTDFTCASPN